MPQYLSTDPNAGLSQTGGDYLSTDPMAGSPLPRRPVSAEDFLPAEPEGSAVGRFFSNAGEMLNPVTMVKGAAHAVMNPIDTVTSLAGAHADQAKKALSRAKEGRYIEAIGHGAATVLPLLGPAAAAAGEQIATGDVAGGLGKGVGLLAPVAIGKALPKAVTVGAPAKNPNPLAAEAVELAQRSGVPIDAATATGNRFVKAAQHVSDRSLGGGMIAGKAAQRQAEGLATLGEQLAAKGSPLPVSAEVAGEGIRNAVTSQTRKFASEADAAYDRLRSFEQHPIHTQYVAPKAGAKPVPMQLPVNVAPVKAAMKDTYTALKRESELVPLMGDKARALTALDRLMNGPDRAPLSVADAALGELKSFARVDEPALRSIGQGVAAGAVKTLDAVVQKTAKDAGRQVYDALKEGRRATVAKYEAGDVLNALADEPVRTIARLTAPKDGALEQLRAVAKQAPAEMPKIGRAVLDDLLGQATSEGGFGHAAALAAKWEKLGPGTKHLLYRDPGYVKDLDRFFHLAKMTADNPNPSGTAHTLLTAGQGGLILTEPVSGVALQIGTAATSKLLHSKTGVRLLTKGMRIPVSDQAASAAWVADLANAGITIPTGSQTVPAGAR